MTRVLKDTLYGRAIAEQDTIGGRYGAISKTLVTGAAPTPQYPVLPERTWSNQTAAIPSEPSLGFSVDALEPLGEK